MEINKAIKVQLFLKVKGWKKIHHANTHQKKAGMALVMSNKVDFTVKNITRDSHFIIRRVIHKENITILNVYKPNNRASKYMTQKLIEL